MPLGSKQDLKAQKHPHLYRWVKNKVTWAYTPHHCSHLVPMVSKPDLNEQTPPHLYRWGNTLDSMGSRDSPHHCSHSCPSMAGTEVRPHPRRVHNRTSEVLAHTAPKKGSMRETLMVRTRFRAHMPGMMPRMRVSLLCRTHCLDHMPVMMPRMREASKERKCPSTFDPAKMRPMDRRAKIVKQCCSKGWRIQKRHRWMETGAAVPCRVSGVRTRRRRVR